MSNVKALTVAHYILKYASERGIPITNLKLQKLLFFCYGWHLAKTGKKLFEDRFEAWPKGPAVYETWSDFKGFGKHPIAADALLFEMAEDLSALDEPLSIYAPLDQWVLVHMSHGPSWRSARGDLPPEARCRGELSDDAVMLEFRRIVSEREAICDDPEDDPEDGGSSGMRVSADGTVHVSMDGGMSALAFSRRDLDRIGRNISESEAGNPRPFDAAELRKRLGRQRAGHA